MSEPAKAVFLSYASQDKEVAAKICDALRAAGVEVWFDQSELRGGDAWDALIRRRIKECALFVPLITPTTNARAEGYFRLEWKLAVDRSHLLADDHPFLFPIVIGDVVDATARVPDKFREVQWTRLRLDETPGELSARIAKLLGGETRVEPAGIGQRSGRRSHWMRNVGMILGLTIGLVYALRPLWAPSRRVEPKPAVVAPAAPVAHLSEARQLAEKARVLFDKIDSNADDYAVAESLLKRALELDATDGVIWAYSARLNAAYLTRSFERGTARAETARNHAERAVKLAPESAEAWHALGRAIWRSDPPRAEEALRHALQLAPDDGHILLSLGSICRNVGRDEDALAFYVRAAAQSEVRPLALYDQFLIHLYMRRFAEAERCGRDAAALLPTTNSVTGLAILEIVSHGRVDTAQRTLDAAPAAMRSEPRMVFAAALAALMAKQSDEALRALDRLPGDFISDAWYSGPKALFVGLAHLQAGRPEAARTAWEAGLAVVRRRLQEAQNDAELHLRLGELLAWTGQAEPALHEARVFEELARTRTDWTFSSARIYAALGRADDAVPILEKFLAATATGRWPLTPALLRLDPLWDKLRGDPRFQKLCEEPDDRATMPATKVDEKSVAVLAFANLSDDKANEYFSDGISEELLNVLAKIPGLKVSARTSAFYFKGKEVPVPEIAKQLGVAYVVEGSVRKAGDKVRITAQLIKADGGFHVWSDTFTRDLKDIFAVQDEIAGLIARNLSLKMGMVAARPTIDLEAYQEYLTGRALFAKAGSDDLKAAVGHFEKALAIEPKFTAAWVQLASVHTQLGRWGGAPPQAAWPAARAAIDRALALEPDSPDVLLASGWVLRTGEWNWRGAERAYRRALELRPNHADTLSAAAVLLFNLGQKDEALALGRRAVQLDPLNPASQVDLSLVFYFSREWIEQEKLVRRAIQLAPTADSYHGLLAFSLAEQRRFAEAEAEARGETDEVGRFFALGIIAALQGKTEAARGYRRQLEERSRAHGDTADLQLGIADISALVGDKDQAFAALEKSVAARDPSVGWFRNDIYLSLLRSDPRWDGLLRKVGLADDQLK